MSNDESAQPTRWFRTTCGASLRLKTCRRVLACTLARALRWHTMHVKTTLDRKVKRHSLLAACGSARSGFSYLPRHCTPRANVGTNVRTALNVRSYVPRATSVTSSCGPVLSIYNTNHSWHRDTRTQSRHGARVGGTPASPPRRAAVSQRRQRAVHQLRMRRRLPWVEHRRSWTGEVPGTAWSA